VENCSFNEHIINTFLLINIINNKSTKRLHIALLIVDYND